MRTEIHDALFIQTMVTNVSESYIRGLHLFITPCHACTAALSDSGCISIQFAQLVDLCISSRPTILSYCGWYETTLYQSCLCYFAPVMLTAMRLGNSVPHAPCASSVVTENIVTLLAY